MWSEAMRFLAPFSEMKQGGSKSFDAEGEKHYTTNYGIYYPVSDKEELEHFYIDIQDELVIGIGPYPPSTEHNFKLDQILTLVGKPNQIYVSAQPDSPIGHLLPAIILLDYSDIGIWASYEYPLEKSGDTLKICPKPVGPQLELWDPEMEHSRRISIEEYVSMVTGFSPKILENVSNMSIESFYQTFQDLNRSICLDTPISFWP